MPCVLALRWGVPTLLPEFGFPSQIVQRRLEGLLPPGYLVAAGVSIHIDWSINQHQRSSEGPRYLQSVPGGKRDVLAGYNMKWKYRLASVARQRYCSGFC